MAKEKTPDENIIAIFSKIQRERDTLKIKVKYWKDLYEKELAENIKNRIGL